MNLSQERKDRKEAFAIIGRMITAQAWRDRNMEHSYEIRGRAIADPSVSSRMFGPRMKSQQWERSSKVAK